ncbi:MAG: hypothetical protein JWP91_1849 [Fibrobacteres bacterium]|nr:hypothetical protein [Fibrobacterota bacterium]
MADALRIDMVPAIGPGPATVARYRPFRLSITLSAPFRNPHDQADIRVDAVFESPTGARLIQPCFFRTGDPGSSRWEARFTPRMAGEHGFHVAVHTPAGSARTAQSRMICVDAEGDGFLGKDADASGRSHGWHFRFDSGRLFRGLGENFGWETPGEPGGTFAERLPYLKSLGCDFLRTWEGPGRADLERGPMGPGRYDEAVAAKVDALLEAADREGIFILSALDTHNRFLTKADYFNPPAWQDNPYCLAKGGMCARPADYFILPEARACLKNRLRYSVARWGYSPNLAAWELWNEVDHLVESAGVPKASVIAWHGEMSACLKGLDPYGRLVSTSLSHHEYPELWSLRDLDFTQRHHYGGTEGFRDLADTYHRSYAKPFVLGEYSLRWQGTDKEPVAAYERELHLGLWRGLFSAMPVLPMSWWWEFHFRHGHGTHLAAAARFLAIMMADGLPLAAAAADGGKDAEALAAGNGREVFLWVRNRGRRILQGQSIRIADLDAGTGSGGPGAGGWTVASFEPRSGEWERFAGAALIDSPGPSLALRVDGLAPDQDRAFRIYRSIGIERPMASA